MWRRRRRAIVRRAGACISTGVGRTSARRKLPSGTRRMRVCPLPHHPPRALTRSLIPLPRTTSRTTRTTSRTTWATSPALLASPKGMFSFLWSQNAPALSIPEHTRSLDWQCAVCDPPPPPTNTLEYELDPIQELFSDPVYQREIVWTDYQVNLTQNLLLSLAQYASSSAPDA